jgi:hypothetical protein
VTFHTWSAHERGRIHIEEGLIGSVNIDGVGLIHLIHTWSAHARGRIHREMNPT